MILAELGECEIRSKNQHTVYNCNGIYTNINRFHQFWLTVSIFPCECLNLALLCSVEFSSPKSHLQYCASGVCVCVYSGMHTKTIHLIQGAAAAAVAASAAAAVMASMPLETVYFQLDPGKGLLFL